MSACEPILNMAILIRLFPQFNPVSINRWNRKTGSKGGRRLPPPSLVVGGVELWTVECILSWAHLHGLSVDAGTLEGVLVDQQS